MNQNEFLKIMQSCRRRLNMAGFLKILLFALSVGAGVGILFQAAAFVTPLYYVNHYTVLALLLALLAAAAAAFVRRVNMEKTALVMDSFGFEERIVTAYENLSQEGAFIELQRKDAMGALRAHQDRIRIPLFPPLKTAFPLLGLLVVLAGLALIPSATKERAQEQHSVKEEAKEKEKEIEELVEALEELAQDELTPEQQAQLQEMIESLESSLSEYQQAVSAEMMAAAAEKLDYKYQNISSQIYDLAQSLQNGAAVSAATLEHMQAMAEQLQKMSGQQLAQGSNANQGQNGQNGQGGENGQGGNGENGQNGQNGQDGQNGQGGNGGNGQNGQDGNGGGEGQNGGQDGNGDGSAGNGRGTGSSDMQHDYVSVPNAIADSGNLMGNAANHDDSDFFRAQNGLSWEGTHISHEAVIGAYEQNAYEGIAAGKYPSGMEEIIKEYFSSFN